MDFQILLSPAEDFEGDFFFCCLSVLPLSVRPAGYGLRKVDHLAVKFPNKSSIYKHTCILLLLCLLYVDPVVTLPDAKVHTQQTGMVGPVLLYQSVFSSYLYSFTLNVHSVFKLQQRRPYLISLPVRSWRKLKSPLTTIAMAALQGWVLADREQLCSYAGNQTRIV